jgi:hypothetical protein
MSFVEVASAVASEPDFQAALESAKVLLRGIFDKRSYIEARLDESQGKSQICSGAWCPELVCP